MRGKAFARMWCRCRTRRGRVVIGTVALASFVSAATAISLLNVEQPSVTSMTELKNPLPSPTLSLSSADQLLFQEAIIKSRILIERLKEKSGAPGIVVGVSVDGRSVWQEGFGYSDLENALPCTPSTVMRIASISKSITMALVAMLWERGELDLDKPVHEYVPHFPKKTYTQDGKEKATFMTSRHLASHLSGIRHYDKKITKKGEAVEAVGEIEQPEYNLKEKFKTVADSLKLFQDDPLRFEPGTGFLYTTHGFTVLSAVVEQVSGAPFPKVACRFFATMGLKHTYLDENEPLIYNRSRFYIKNKNGQLENSPYVDCSYKWAGGGFLSDVNDLVRFGNIMLYAAGWQDVCSRRRCPPGLLKSDTVKALWTPTSPKGVVDGWSYGLGWSLRPQPSYFGMCGSTRPKKIVCHDGGAMGATSTLVLRLPDVENTNKENCHGVIMNNEECMPRGIVVAMVTNLNRVFLRRTAMEIAELFDASS